MKPRERLFFALAVLRNEPDTHFVLSDLLEEDGDRSLANWARARKGTKHKRLDFVLGVLPYLVSLRLGTDFLAHSLQSVDRRDRESWHSFGGYDHSARAGTLAPLIKAVQTISLWTHGEANSDELNDAVMTASRVGPWAYGIKDIDTTMQTLHAAARCAEIAESSRERLDGASLKAHATQASNGARRVAKAARNIHSDIQWHVDQTECLLTDLLDAKDDSG